MEKRVITNPDERLAYRLGIVSCICSFLFYGCTVGPSFSVPATPAVASLTERGLPSQTAHAPGKGGEAQRFVVTQTLPDHWWTLYGSDSLDVLVDRALKNSPTIAAAEASLRAANASVLAERGGLYPTAGGSLGATRQKMNGASEGFPQAGSFLYTLYNSSLTLGYNFDVFGGTRHAIEGQQAESDVKRYELEAAYQTVAANVVTGAIREASLIEQIEATRESIALAKHEVDLNRERYQLGGTTAADVLSSESNQAALEATLPPLERDLATIRGQLAVYVGIPPADYHERAFRLDALQLPRSIPLSLPSTVVTRRPDVREAEAQLRKACADVGVATANLLPQISLNASIGGASDAVTSLLRNGVFSIAGNLVQPLFEGGTLLARRRAAIAEYQRAQAQYRQTVLGAFLDVSNALGAIVGDGSALAAAFHAQDAASRALKLIATRYSLGGATSLDLLIGQIQYQKARIEYVKAVTARYQDTAGLFLALGGDWHTDTIAH